MPLAIEPHVLAQARHDRNVFARNVRLLQNLEAVGFAPMHRPHGFGAAGFALLDRDFLLFDPEVLRHADRIALDPLGRRGRDALKIAEALQSALGILVLKVLAA